MIILNTAMARGKDFGRRFTDNSKNVGSLKNPSSLETLKFRHAFVTLISEVVSGFVLRMILDLQRDCRSIQALPGLTRTSTIVPTSLHRIPVQLHGQVLLLVRVHEGKEQSVFLFSRAFTSLCAGISTRKQERMGW